jgi:hypothetical protein
MKPTSKLSPTHASAALVLLLGPVFIAGDPQPSVGPETDFWKLPRVGRVEHAWIHPSAALRTHFNAWLEPFRTRVDDLSAEDLASLQQEFARAFTAKGMMIAHGGISVSCEAYWFQKTHVDPGAWGPAIGTAVGVDIVIREERSHQMLAKLRHSVLRERSVLFSDLVVEIVGELLKQ